MSIRHLSRRPPRFPCNSFCEPVLYSGPSMAPTLKTGDRLQIVPCEPASIRRGDVIVFQRPDSAEKVVHRVIFTDERGFTTRGDNCRAADDWTVAPGQVVGRVVRAHRGEKTVEVPGGFRGTMVAARMRAVSRVGGWLRSSLGPAYLRLARSRTARRLRPRIVNTRVVCFKRASGTELQLLWGRHVIGRRRATDNVWRIRPPFRFFVDETSLPH